MKVTIINIFNAFLFGYFRCAAKFLWKRIPESIKKEHTELKKIWDIGVALWNQNFSVAYNALNQQEWSESVKTIMQAVTGDNFFQVKYLDYFSASEIFLKY